MRLVLVVLTIVLSATVATAGPTEDQLAACRADAVVQAGALRDEKTARTAYEAKLAELLAELREQLDQARTQLTMAVQERDRLRAEQATKALPAPKTP